MMDHKTWLWRKKITDKTMVADDKVNLAVRGNEEETDKAELERDLKVLNEKLSSARESTSGQEKAEAEAILLKQELGKALQEKVAGEERVMHLEGALRECMQQLRLVREEQEKGIHEAVMKTSRESERKRIVLEEKITETDKRLAKLDAENTQLRKALLAKEKVIEDLNEQRVRTEADFNTLTIRLESKEKENSSLKYEVRVLEKELEIRNEEREFNRRTADVAHKQHLDSVKKIAKLESECQRLRLLVRKRLPGPAALAKMKTEVEILGRDPAEARRRKSNPSPTGSMDFAVENTPDTPSKRINFLTEQLCVVEEENKTLKETLIKRTEELQFSKIMHTSIASKLSQVHSQPEESLKGQIAVGSARNLSSRHEFSLGSMSEIGSDDRVSCAESWASGLMLELEHFRNGKQTGTSSCRTVGTSDINLMDDFVEMEKLTIVSTDKPCGNSHLSSRIDSPDRVAGDHASSAKNNHQIQSNLSKSILKTIELIEGISLPSPEYGIKDTSSGKDDSFPSFENSETPTGYMVRVFQWKTSELSDVLQQFVKTCNDMLNGKADLERFSKELNSALEWIMNHCFSLQDVSSMRDAIKKHFDWDESISESEVEGGMSRQFLDEDKLHAPQVQLSRMPIVSAWNGHKKYFQMEGFQPKVRGESGRLKNELENMEYAMKDLEERLQLETDKSESLMIRLQESEKTIEILQKEVETLKQSKGVVEERIENHNMVKEVLGTQLTVAKAELNEARQKFSTLEKEMETKNNYCEELKSTCLDLQLQLERVSKKEIPKYDVEEEEKQLQTDWEITAASEKLAECQETILNLGKQLKALASSGDEALFDKVVSVPTDAIATTATPKKSMNQRSSLLDKMLAEDIAESRDLRSPKTKEVICTSKSPTLGDCNSYSMFGLNRAIDLPDGFPNSKGIKVRDGEAGIDSLAIVPSTKKGGGGWLKKLFWRRKKGHSKKTPCLCHA